MRTQKQWMISSAALLAAAGLALADPPADPHASTAAASESIGLLVQQSGGSLFRAEIASQPAPPPGEVTNGPDGHEAAAPGTVGAISFFAVEPPAPKRLKKHDLVTIIAKEVSAFTSNGDSTLQKEQDIDDKLNAFVTLHASSMKLASVISGATNVPEINITNSRDFKGTGEVDRTDTFSDRVTAEVVDVKPNGTLVLQAVKQIKTDEEMQRMVLSGICRAEDISADNTILSTQLFDLELTQSHSGAVSDTTSRGLFPRLLDTFSPF
ncbi:MAG TPA: flagellar basal body L-ring protein FlgH [Tepidisphaeraceae bacterium]|nr:flagellar basal body L-ring protein FlgH [Tepidisphaeraceae bacterium]